MNIPTSEQTKEILIYSDLLIYLFYGEF